MFVMPARTRTRSAHRQYIDSFKPAPVKKIDGNLAVDIETDKSTGLPVNLGPEYGIDILTPTEDNPVFGIFTDRETLQSKLESAKNAATQANKSLSFSIQAYMDDSVIVLRTA